MTDNLSKRHSGDEKFINVNENYELNYWSNTLGITTTQLKDLVNEVGTSAQAVRQRLAKVRKGKK